MNRARRLIVSGAAASLALATACQMIVGIGDDRFTVVQKEGGADTQPQPPSDQCVHASPPGAPDASDNPSDDVSMVLGMRNVNVFGLDDAGAPLGFDLDGVCTCDPLDQSSKGGTPTCVNTAPKPVVAGGCDFDGGIDNAIVPILRDFKDIPQFELLSLMTTRQIECGRLNLLVFVRGYNGRADDARVEVGVLESFGIQEPHASEPANERCSFEEGKTKGPYPARFDDTDRWTVRTNFVTRAGASPWLVRGGASGHVSNYTLVLDGRKNFDLRIPVIFGADLIEIRSPMIVGKLVPLDQNGAPMAIGGDNNPVAKPSAWSMRNALFTGRALADDVVSRIGALPIDEKVEGPNRYLCGDRNFAPYVTLKRTICAAVDLRHDPNDDGKDYPCDALSIQLGFDAVPITIGKDFDPNAPDAGCGEGWRDTCP